jgi:hypothetical protein
VPRLLAVAAAALLATSTLLGQVRSVPPPRIPSPFTGPNQTSTVTGQVVDESGRPVSTVVMRLVGERAVRTLITDNRGRFAYPDVIPGEYVLIASKRGFFDGGYGKRRPHGTPLPFSLAATQSIENMRIELFRAGVITGVVLDEASEPVIGARVVASRREFVEGEWQYFEAGGDTSDDRGTYRIFGLVPGEYIVSTPTMQATLPGGARVTTRESDTLDDGFAYARQFYPVTPHFLLALPVGLGSGETRYAVDFRWMPVPARTVSGRLAGRAEDVGQQLLRLVPVDTKDMGLGAEAAITVSDEAGVFVFQRVPAGDYRLEAGPGFVLSEPALADVIEKPPATMWGRLDVQVADEDVKDLELRMLPAVSISGTIALSSAQGDAVVGGVGVSLVPTAPGLSPVTAAIVKGDRFEAPQLVPGRYFIRISALPSGRYLQAITEDGANRLDTPVDASNGDLTDVAITLTDLPTELTGTVRNARNEAAAGAALIVMPAQQATWTPHRTRLTRASTNGLFTITGLPPGDYLIVAVDDAMTEGWQDYRKLSQLRTMGTRITLRANETVTLHMRIK